MVATQKVNTCSYQRFVAQIAHRRDALFGEKRWVVGQHLLPAEARGSRNLLIKCPNILPLKDAQC